MGGLCMNINRSSLGDMIEEMYLQRELRREHEAVIEFIKKQERILEYAIYDVLNQSGIKQASSKSAQFSMQIKEAPKVTDWDKVYKFILTTHEFGLLHKRISLGLWKEAKEEGILIPGIETVEMPSYTLRVKK